MVMIHGPLAWARASNAQKLDSLDDLESDFLEQSTIRLAETLAGAFTTRQRSLFSWHPNSFRPSNQCQLFHLMSLFSWNSASRCVPGATGVFPFGSSEVAGS